MRKLIIISYLIYKERINFTLERLVEIAYILFPQERIRVYSFERECFRCKRKNNNFIGTIEYVTPNLKKWKLNEFSFILFDNSLKKKLVDDGIPFKLRFSNVLKTKYWVNVCEYCDVIQGDFYIMQDFPDEPDDDWLRKHCVYDKKNEFEEEEDIYNFIESVNIIKQTNENVEKDVYQCPYCSSELGSNTETLNIAVTEQKTHKLSLERELWMCKGCNLLLYPDPFEFEKLVFVQRRRGKVTEYNLYTFKCHLFGIEPTEKGFINFQRNERLRRKERKIQSNLDLFFNKKKK
ncbi:MAG: hypothetical protein HGN29_01545 [Asgard group archaeon]|nr:hypothetical protein [Asgard group archaeon]